MEKVLQEAIMLNNVGVEHIVDGLCEQAVPILVDAHEMLRESVGFPPTHSARSLMGSQHESFFTCPFNSMDFIMANSPHLNEKVEDLLILRSRCCPTPPRRPLHTTVVDSDTTSLPPPYTFYYRPIVLPRNLPLVCYDSHITICIAAMFNLALAHQIIALNTRDYNQSRIFFRKALKLYAVVYQLHYSEEQNNEIHGLPMLSRNILLLALMTNSSHIHLELGEPEKAENCFRHLFASLMWLRSTHWWENRRTNEHSIDDKIFDVFFQTASTWLEIQSLHECVAAAA